MRITMRCVLALLAFSLIQLAACQDGRQYLANAIPVPTETAVATVETRQNPDPVIWPTGGSSALQISDEGYDLVFSGGGAKGIAHIGALMELERRGVPYRRVVGTSAGTIIGLLLASGYSADEIVMAITERTPDGKIIMAEFLDVPESFPEETVRDSFLYALMDTALTSALPEEIGEQALEIAMEKSLEPPVLREAFSFTEFGGVYAGDALVYWLQEKLEKDSRSFSQLTLAEFREQTGSDLTAIATDITGHRMLILNHRTAPDLPVAMLVRMSMSIPFVYKHVIWLPEWGAYMGEEMNGREIVDGGLSSNFGIEMVVSQEEQFVAAMGMGPDRDRVIGFYLDETIPVPGAERPEPEPDEVIDPLHSRWERVTQRNEDLLTTLLSNHDQFIVRTHPDVVSHLPVGGFTTLEFDMSDARIKLLLESGQEAMAQCLDEMGITGSGPGS